MPCRDFLRLEQVHCPVGKGTRVSVDVGRIRLSIEPSGQQPAAPVEVPIVSGVIVWHWELTFSVPPAEL